MGRKSCFVDYIRKLREYYFLHRRLPSFEQLTDVLWVNSKRTVHRFFQQCLEQDYLIKIENNYIPTKKLSGLPLFGSIPAWSPDDATDAKQDDVRLDELLVENPAQTVLLKAQWDSMVDAGILSWDLMTVDIQKKAYEGDIVIGVVDNEFTVKYLRKDTEQKRYLKAANQQKDYPNIYASDELRIYWVVTGIVRKL